MNGRNTDGPVTTIETSTSFSYNYRNFNVFQLQL